MLQLTNVDYTNCMKDKQWLPHVTLTLLQSKRHAGVVLSGVYSQIIVIRGRFASRRQHGRGGERSDGRRLFRDEDQSAVAFAEGRQLGGDFVRRVGFLTMRFQILMNWEWKEWKDCNRKMKKETEWRIEIRCWKRGHIESYGGLFYQRWQ